MSAFYEYNDQMTDDESLSLSFEITNEDGSAPDWADLSFEFSLQGNGVSLLLTEASGITTDTLTNIITIAPAATYRLPVGVYGIGLRSTSTASGQTIQWLDGNITVSEGNF